MNCVPHREQPLALCFLRPQIAAADYVSPPISPVLSPDSRNSNLSIDPDPINRALEVSGERTKKAAVTKELQEFIARRRQKRLLDLMGRLEWDDTYVYKAERTRD